MFFPAGAPFVDSFYGVSEFGNPFVFVKNTVATSIRRVNSLAAAVRYVGSKIPVPQAQIADKFDVVLFGLRKHVVLFWTGRARALEDVVADFVVAPVVFFVAVVVVSWLAHPAPF